ncbi:polysaccharide biosynthesis/export family protein [Abditibacterium utsteinense]|nr:SLBB domain-containing protein [Abditibacterium utsteinense]
MGKARALTFVSGLSLIFLAGNTADAQAKVVRKPVSNAQSSVRSSKANRAAASARYVVGPDDVLGVTILKHPEFSVANVVVPQNGLITVPVVGTVRATGKTLEQLDAEITQGLGNRLRKPEVAITLEKPRPRPIYVVGQVKSPGIYEAKNNWRVTQALAAAGGLSVDTDLAAVIVNRNNRKLVDSFLLPLLKDPNSASNVVLRSGDSIRFYERKVTVSVTGAVTRPGIYSVPVGSGIVQAIGLAGGSVPAAALTKASVRRSNGQIVPINLFKALLENDADSNISLVEGDVIVVPEQKDRVSVLGAVVKPGFFPMEDGRALKVADAIALAGGPQPNAALTRAVLRRADGTEQPLDLYRLLVQGVQADNVVLHLDDIISIPEARGVTVIGEVEKPGTYPLEEGKAPRVSDALAVAGGLKIKPELSRIAVARLLPNGKSVSLSVDAVSLLELSSPAQNSLMQDGDIISVSALKMATVFVNGEVKTPGAYQLAEGDGVVELVSRAGGPTPDAALSQISVTERNGDVKVVDTAAALLEGSTRTGGPLHDGDIVVVPRSKQRVLVVGAVSKPGSYALPEDRPLTIGDALSLAGGPQNTARVKTITLLRPNGQVVTRTILHIDRPENGLLAVNQPIQNGDVIYVPEGKPRQSTLDTVSRFLPGLGYLLN